MPEFGSWASDWWKPEVDIGWMYITLLSLFGLAEVKYARVGAHVRVAE